LEQVEAAGVAGVRGGISAGEKNGEPVDESEIEAIGQPTLITEKENFSGAETPANPRFPRSDAPDEQWRLL